MQKIDTNLYLFALQHPQEAFTDEELKEATVVYEGWRPYARSGKFAVVYKLETRNGPKAVRCFYYPNTEHEERYRLFHDHIQAQHLGCLTQFEYLPQGIVLQEGSFPIVKMDWVEGETLDKRLESMVEQQDVRGLEKLSGLWRDAIVGLQQASIAHGDMQHANILTRNGSLCLVDYDGVFIPSFQGKNALEAGHRNYQHPGRAESKSFGLNIDHFSAFVIYLSILALATDPKLWKTFHQDEALILLETDYRTPNKSEILKKLKRNGETQVRELAQKLEYVCTQSVDAVPRFESLVPIPTAAPSKPHAGQRGPSEGAWWNDLQGLNTTPAIIPATGTTQGSVGSTPAPGLPARNPIPAPTQKKGSKRVLLVLLVLLILLAACAFLFLAVAGGYYYF
jgi:predicted Ser/Thr protein kinase